MAASDWLVVAAATLADRSTIENLIQLYLYDMAGDHPFPVGEDGRYDYGLLDDFWQYPYLFRVDGEIAGFALVIDHCPVTGKADCWFMAEFFVMRPYRRQSVGDTMFRRVVAQHPGQWHVATQVQNSAADRFWSSATGTMGAEEFKEHFDDADWVVRSFQSAGG